MEILLKINKCSNISLARLAIMGDTKYQHRLLVKESIINELISDQPAHVILNTIMARTWNTPAKRNSTILTQYYHHHKKGTSKIVSIVLTMSGFAGRLIEMVEIDLTQLEQKTYIKYAGTEGYWNYLASNMNQIAPDFLSHPNCSNINYDDFNNHVLCAPVRLQGAVKSITQTSHKPRYNQLLDVAHLDTSDNQYEMIDVVNRLANSIQWKERAFTDRLYYHRAVVEGRHHTEVQLFLFPDRTKMVIVHRLFNYNIEIPMEQWIGVSKFNDTVRNYLKDINISYDFHAGAFTSISNYI